jgi:hypothetical protein
MKRRPNVAAAFFQPVSEEEQLLGSVEDQISPLTLVNRFVSSHPDTSIFLFL